MKTRILKKIFLSAIIIFALALCMACGDTDAGSGDKDPTKGAKPTKSASENTGKTDEDPDTGEKNNDPFGGQFGEKDDKQDDKKDDEKQPDDKKDDKQDDGKKDDKQDDGKKDDGNHAETYDNYYYLLNYYDDNVLYGYVEDGQFVFWPGLWVSFGDGYVQYNWQYIDQNAYSSRPGDSPSGTTRITVFSDGGQDDWGSYEVIYSEDVVKLRSSDAEEGAYLVFINSKLIDYKGDICAQIKAVTGLDMKMPVDE